MNEFSETTSMQSAQVALNTAYKAVLAAKDAVEAATWDMIKILATSGTSEAGIKAVDNAGWNAMVAVDNALAAAAFAAAAASTMATQYAKFVKTDGQS